MKEHKFTWKAWDFDSEGEAYIISKRECPDRAKVVDYILMQDHLDPAYRSALERNLREGWCAYQCRSDWMDTSGAMGWYVVELEEKYILNLQGVRKRGWFPVWVIRKDTW